MAADNQVMRSLVGIGVTAACALLMAGSGCGREPADAAGATPVTRAQVPQRPPPAQERPAAGGAGRAVMRAFSFAPSETIRLAPEEQPTEPTAEYPSLEAARDSLLALVRRVMVPGDTAIHVRAGPAGFKYWYAPDSASGYAVQVVVTDTSSCPDVEVEKALAVAGWAHAAGYSADGPDGTVMGFVTRRYLCVLEGRWDGGDDSDTTYVPAPGCELTVTCVPRRKDDVPGY